MKMPIPFLSELESQSEIGLLLDETMALPRIPIEAGPAHIAGIKVRVICADKISVFFMVKKKQFKLPRHALFGICKQRGNYVV